MRTQIKSLLVIMVTVTASVVPLAPTSAWADTAPTPCVGDTETLIWSAPADTTGFAGYLIQQRLVNDVVNGSVVDEFSVGLDQTSVTVQLQFGLNTFLVWGLNIDGTHTTVVGGNTWSAAAAPMPTSWQVGPYAEPGFNSVGDGTATVSFSWPEPIRLRTTGNSSDNTEVISGAGTSFTFRPFTGTATATFTGLANGSAYTFTSDTFNSCGDGGGDLSPTFVPGVGPAWTANTPPLTGHHGAYQYRFRASGKPAPSYALVDAPEWLHIDDGLVSGKVPKATTRFSYSVVARNGVGIIPFTHTDITAGPFTVDVRTPGAHG